MGHVCLEFLMVGVLDVDGPAPEVGYTRREIAHHLHGRRLIRHLQECLKRKKKILTVTK